MFTIGGYCLFTWSFLLPPPFVEEEQEQRRRRKRQQECEIVHGSIINNVTVGYDTANSEREKASSEGYVCVGDDGRKQIPASRNADDDDDGLLLTYTSGALHRICAAALHLHRHFFRGFGMEQVCTCMMGGIKSACTFKSSAHKKCLVT